MNGNSKSINGKKVLLGFFYGCLAASIMLTSSCGSSGSNGSGAETGTGTTVTGSTEAAADPNATADPNAADPNTTADVSADPNATPQTVDLSQYPDVPLPQLDPVPDGEEVAVLHTDDGDMTLRFFPTYAPKAVQNFKTLAKSGYYDGNIINRVFPNEYVQSGDPTGSGTGGQSIWGQPFPAEPSPTLHNIYGAVSMVLDQTSGMQGSQFMIIANKQLSDDNKATLESYKGIQDQVIGTTSDGQAVPYAEIFPTKIIDKYLESGGVPGIDMQYAVFAQVVGGLDVLDKIASAPTPASENPPASESPQPTDSGQTTDSAQATDAASPTPVDSTQYKPVTDIKINSITFEPYKAS